MKKIILASVVVVTFAFTACNSKTNSEKSDSTTTQQESSSTPAPAPASSTPANEPKSYTVTFSPDTVFLGKKKEAFLKLTNGKAVELYDADGKITGIELTYAFDVTNKNQMGGNNVFINPNDFRLQLDNGNNITHDNYNSVSAQPESTNQSADNKFKLPPGTKPKALNLFYDETRVAVQVEMK